MSADEMLRTPERLPLSYITLYGHGSYPRATFIPRMLLAFNSCSGIWEKLIEFVGMQAQGWDLGVSR